MQYPAPKHRSAKLKDLKQRAITAFDAGDFDTARNFVKLYCAHINTQAKPIDQAVAQQQWASQFLGEINATDTAAQVSV